VSRTFIWPPEARWPPPVDILLNYDVVLPDGVILLRRESPKATRGANPMESFVALITPLGAGPPGYPAHPIAPGGPPPGIWGGAPPYPDQGLPPSGVGVWPSPGRPAHPIAPGGPPPGIWGGAPPYPDIGGPAPQPPTQPPWWPGYPAHPIPPIVSHPIPPPEGLPEYEPKIEWQTAWSPSTGWVVVGVPTVPVPTPAT
jgi:hypothetical protein